MSNLQQVACFKEVMGNYPTGVTVITTFDTNHRPVGMTVNSFAAVSLEPLLILWSIDKNATAYESFLKVEKFSVNILAADQADLCTLFSSKAADRFSQCEWTESKWSLPVLSNALAVFQCKTFNKVEAGDHTILIGEVIDIHNHYKSPLLYHKRRFVEIPEVAYQ